MLGSSFIYLPSAEPMRQHMHTPRPSPPHQMAYQPGLQPTAAGQHILTCRSSEGAQDYQPELALHLKRLYIQLMCGHAGLLHSIFESET